MNLFLANPAGLWALLAIPAILAIHFLQTKARRVVVSTLFLIEEMEKESLGGRRLERLRNSVPLWLQLLCALLLTWILCQPRWLRKENVQSIVVLLDASVSMEGFRADLAKRIEPALSKLGASALQTEWTFVDTNASNAPMYNGTNLGEALLSLQKWRPLLTGHDFQRAFSLARSLTSENGAVVFVTDHPVEIPEGISLLAIGEPMENCGFAGVNVTREKWEASLKNYGTKEAIRTWRLLGSDGKEVKSEAVALAPGQSVTIGGDFTSQLLLRLEIERDAFHLDDVLPLVRPVGKTLRVQYDPSVSLYEEVMKTEPGLVAAATGETPDLAMRTYDPLAPASIGTNAILSVKEPSPDGKLQQGAVYAEKDPLAEDLSWQGLTIRDSLQAPAKPGDRMVVWQGERPLIYVRPMTENRRQLFLNFDIEQSNARRIPGFIVLLTRFLKQVREITPGLEVANFESNQRVPVAFREPSDDLNLEVNSLANPEDSIVRKISPEELRVFRAPVSPSVIQVSQGKEVLLQGATHFADVREANFSKAGSADQVKDLAQHMIERQSEDDFLTPVWGLLLAIAMLGNYAWLGRKR